MSPPASPNNQDMILGELRGQVRELVHGVNGLSQKFDALSREVIGLGPLAADIAKMEARLTALEVEQNRRDGASGVMLAILKSPAVGWLVGLATTAWAVFTGRLHL